MESSFFRAARRGNNAISRYLITILLVIMGAFVGQIPLGIALMNKNSTGGPIAQDEIDKLMFGLNTHLALCLVLLTFALALLALYIGVKYIHQKRFTDVLTGRMYLDWNRVLFSFGLWFALAMLIEFVTYMSMPEKYIWQFEWKAFLLLLPIALLMLPLQTTFEEAFFRGYLMQGIGLLSSSRILALLLTSVIFGLMHLANPEVEKFGLELMMGYYIGFGLLMGVCTLMDEGTEIAIGLHAANNIYGITIVSFSGAALESPTIFSVEELNAELMLIAALAASIVFLIVVALKYRWNNWTKLFKSIAY
jgi:membrane protease YdiL (CAAX protease family)